MLYNLNLKNKTILITGAAGFIGSNLVMELLRTLESVHIVGLDNMNDYYDVSIKEYRLAQIKKLAAEKTASKWTFIKGNIADKILIEELFTEHTFDVVVNLAAQAGVRYSIDHPDVYMESNIIGFYNILISFNGKDVNISSVMPKYIEHVCFEISNNFSIERRSAFPAIFESVS